MIDRHIQIQNIYYMLSYAFKVLQEDGYKHLGSEEFKNTADLFAAILIQGVNVQLKRGLTKEYIEKSEELSSLRGKIDVNTSLKKNSLIKKQLECIYDDYSVDTSLNQIIKSTFVLLMKSDIKTERKKDIRNLLMFLVEVSIIDLHTVNWNVNYSRNNQTYKMLIGICYFTVKGLLHSENGINMKIMDFLDEQRMCRLYEKFILEYYRKEHSELKANSKEIDWQLDDDIDNMLPVMQSDIMLEKGTTVLIIDAKYYSHTTQVQFDKHTIHSANIYQIFTYVKNKEAELNDKVHKVSGMLLYARTDEDIQPDETYQMSGNQISVKTLDLNVPFDDIRNTLDKIAISNFAQL